MSSSKSFFVSHVRIEINRPYYVTTGHLVLSVVDDTLPDQASVLYQDSGCFHTRYRCILEICYAAVCAYDYSKPNYRLQSWWLRCTQDRPIPHISYRYLGHVYLANALQ